MSDQISNTDIQRRYGHHDDEHCGGNCDGPDNSCTATFEEALCVEFEVTFTVDICDCKITDVTCMGPCSDDDD